MADYRDYAAEERRAKAKAERKRKRIEALIGKFKNAGFTEEQAEVLAVTLANHEDSRHRAF